MEKDNAVERAIGRRIQQIRREKGYTQQQFAELVGLSTYYLSDVERGKSSVRLDKLAAIINALGCCADDVFIDVTDYGHKLRMTKLTERIARLPQQDQQRIAAIVETLLQVDQR